jgi:hypothetical protein
LLIASSSTPADTLEAHLANFTVKTVQEIETLIRSLTEKGADRAVNLLLEGQFTTFFGLSLDQVSYAGNLMSTLKSTARQDLPVRKTNRKDNNTSRLIASTATPDFEFDSSDLDPNTPVNPPAS